ncbi:MAG: hypothetical protein O2950_10685 [Proteobacteria bacterium]|jgi:hypothetical protein|uniref:Uncharacterized protein n=1 Tax=SAR92 bacterium BACL26 MAG-121220-bin70 TaxID=1655626 RepID=A0A0R2UIW5_9GAMM|nr:MAG: hypothetical protein ABS24_07720 [SAR92 bacterium BACL26 MAG-121220-bin70]MDA0796775.1 hypothetical protein [Pseudomonadota bacterium]MDA1352733.1 hypothetical protein [Pseudomonadota bacterium]|tara:strand:- start:2626 stop:2835 length:210 start_codon:yes stop_codon:yes gene_type:complete
MYPVEGRKRLAYVWDAVHENKAGLIVRSQGLIDSNDDVYISGSIKEADYGVFRKGDAYLDPITGGVVGA